MSLPDPLDPLLTFPGWTSSFELNFRQEQSRQANGRTIVKDFGTPLWSMTAQSRTMKPNELDFWRGRLNALENGINLFKGYSLSRVYPSQYPNGSWPTGGSFSGTTAILNTIASNRKQIKVSFLPAGFQVHTGDMLRIGDYLFQAAEAETASGGGVTDLFEVRPHLPAGLNTNAAVSVKYAYCLMALVPGSVVTDADPRTGRGTVSFSGYEVRE